MHLLVAFFFPSSVETDRQTDREAGRQDEEIWSGRIEHHISAQLSVCHLFSNVVSRKHFVAWHDGMAI